MKSLIAFIVLNWNNARDTISCLESLAKLDYPNPWIIVVDNGSSDDSIIQIQAAHPNVTPLGTGANLGYAGGNNVGVQYALEQGGELICILNNDVVVEPDFLTPMLAVLHSRPDVGVVTPLVAERTDAGERVWALGSAIDWRTAAITRRYAGSVVDPWRACTPFEVDVASGAAMLVRREIFERVGLMDESFFLYFEEVDWSLNVRNAGYHIMAVPTSVVWHKVSAALGKTSPTIDYYMTRNHLLFVMRHWTGLQRYYILTRLMMRTLATIVTFTVKSHGGHRIPNRNAKLMALRDAVFRRWGEMPLPSPQMHQGK